MDDQISFFSGGTVYTVSMLNCDPKDNDCWHFVSINGAAESQRINGSSIAWLMEFGDCEVHSHFACYVEKK